MQIYIVRHGETENNKDKRLQGWLDAQLNERGRELARLTGIGLKGVRFDAAFSSPLKRAYETAELILQYSNNHTDLSPDDRLKEINVGNWQGKSMRPEDGEVPEEEMNRFFHNTASFSGFPNGETIVQLCTRTQEFLKELVGKEYQTVLVATHATALRAMLRFLYENQDNFWQGKPPLNCAVSIVESRQGCLRLVERDRIFY